MVSTKLRLAVASVGVLLLFGACGGGGEEASEPAVAQEVELEAYDFYFEETAFTFDLGDQVTVDFVNAGEATHSFTADELDIDVEAPSGESTEITFSVPDQPGVFDFFCKYHPDQMSGTISIGGSDEPIEEIPEDEGNDADVEVDVDNENDPGAGGGIDY